MESTENNADMIRDLQPMVATLQKEVSELRAFLLKTKTELENKINCGHGNHQWVEDGCEHGINENHTKVMYHYIKCSLCEKRSIAWKEEKKDENM
jgi:hypothetical protein